MAYTFEPGPLPRVRRLRKEPLPPHARLPVVAAAAGLFRDGMVIAREAAIPLRRLAARNLDDWAQNLAHAVSATGRSVAYRVGPDPDCGLDRSPVRGYCNSEEMVQRALAALRSEPDCQWRSRNRTYGKGVP